MKHCIPNTSTSTVKGEGGIAYNLSSASIDRLSPIVQLPAKISTSTETKYPNLPTDDIKKTEAPGPVHDQGQGQGRGQGHGEKKLHKCSPCGRFFSTCSSLKVHTTRWCTYKRVDKQKIHKQKIRSGNKSKTAHIISETNKAINTENSLRIRKSTKTKTNVESASQTQRRSSRNPKVRFPPETLCDSYQHQVLLDLLDEYNNGPENFKNVENKNQTSQPQQQRVETTTVTGTKTNKKFKSQKSQQMLHHNNSSIFSPFVCRFCTQCFTSPENRSIHENERHMPAVNPYKCKSCERRFIFAEDCSFHESLHSETWAKLELGETGSKKNKKRAQNQRVNNTVTTETCTNSATATEENSTRAISSISSSVSQPNLTLIPIAIQKIMEVKTNTDTTHVNSSKPFVCSTCNKSFATSGSRNTHNKIHTGHFPYECKLCRRKYVSVGRLNYHLKVSACATKNRMLVSGITNEAEADAETQEKNEMQIKQKQLKAKGRGKGFPCNVCAKRLKSQITLIQHALVHNKPFKCQYCPKLTSRKDLWLRHEKIHTEKTTAKYYFCHVCNLPCRVFNNLQIHLKDVHPQ